MKLRTSFLVLFICLPLFFVKPQKDFSLGSYNFSKAIQVRLDKSLTEISGLTFSGEKLFTHNDEAGIIFQLEPGSGKILKIFSLGDKKLRKDFEGIDFTKDKFYLITSNGDI